MNKSVLTPFILSIRRKKVRFYVGIILAAQVGIGTNLDQDCTAGMPSTGSNYIYQGKTVTLPISLQLSHDKKWEWGLEVSGGMTFFTETQRRLAGR